MSGLSKVDVALVVILLYSAKMLTKYLVGKKIKFCNEEKLALKLLLYRTVAKGN